MSREPDRPTLPASVSEAMVQQSLDGLMVLDDGGRVQHANPAAHRILGRPPGGLLGTVFGRPTADETPSELTVPRPDGSPGVVELRATEIRMENRPAYLVCLRDITDLARSQQALRAERNRARGYLEVAAVMLLGLDREGRINLINPRGCEILGQDDADSLLGRDWIDFVPADQRAEVRRLFQDLLDEKADPRTPTEGKLQTAAGAVRTIVWHNALVRDEGGRVIGTLSSGEDVTDRRQMEAQLAQADRLSSMGMLAAGVAHEINNPLAYVVYNLESATADMSALVEGLAAGEHAVLPDDLRDLGSRLKDAFQGTLRIRDIAQSLSTFSRVETDRPEPVDLHQVIDAAAQMARNEIKYRAELIRAYGQIPPVLASEGRLSQVFLNLLINAVHAIEAGDKQDNVIAVRTWAEGEDVWVEVRDTGVGIAPEHLPRLFDPFFTTKEIGVGSGLGLSISKNIIEGYKGAISITSTPGQGTRCTIRLPRCTQARPAAAAVPARERAPTDRSRILVVDDEHAIRRVIGRMLREHEVVTAESGAVAKQLIEADQAFDLIVCDMMMPEISGIDLHRWLRGHHPDLARRFVFVTGGAFTPEARAYLEEVDTPRLEKPFDVPRFKQLVAEKIRAGT